ncbi:glycosyltransferase [Caulobacter segnis]
MLNVGIFRLQLFKQSETFINSQAQALERYHPVFIGRREFGPAPAGADIVTTAANTIGSAAAMLTGSPRAMLRALGTKRIDVVHAHFGVDGTYALPLAKRINCPLVTTLHGFDVTASDAFFLKSGRPALMRYVAMRKRLQREGDLFLCVSDFIRNKAIERGFPADKTVLHYIGTRNVDMQARTAQREIIHVARLVEKKGTSYLISAMRELQDRGLGATLTVVGDGPLRGALEAQVDQLALRESVVFLGALPHEEVLRRISNATVMAVPSVTASNGDAEGLPTVVMEAAARGTPIIATPSGGTAEAIIDHETGLIVPERDAEALANSLEQLLTGAGEAERLSIGAHNLARTKFNLSSQTSELERLYDSIRRGQR